MMDVFLPGVTVFLCGMAIALLGHLCHSPSVMLFNFIATPIELRLVNYLLELAHSYGGLLVSFCSNGLILREFSAQRLFTLICDTELLAAKCIEGNCKLVAESNLKLRICTILLISINP